MFFFAVKSGFNGSNVYVKGICTPELEIKQLNLYVMWKKKVFTWRSAVLWKNTTYISKYEHLYEGRHFGSLLLWSFQVYVNTILRREDTSNI